MKKQKFIPALGLLATCAIIASAAALGGAYNEMAIAEGHQAWWTVVFNPCYSGAELSYSRGYRGETIEMEELARSGFSLLGWSETYNKSTKMGDSSSYYTLDQTYTIEGKNKVLYAVWKQYEAEEHTEEEIDAYMEGLKSSSKDGHLYVHYYRWANSADDYAEWDIWSWPYRPHEAEGYNFDFSSEVDTFGGGVCDIDMTKTYDGGWDNVKKTVGGSEVSYYDEEGKLDTQVGIQIVKKATRQDPEAEFWSNDGGNIYIPLADAAVSINGGGTAYHVFCVQDSAQDWTVKPLAKKTDPFANDDGTNVTKGDDKYDNANWNDKEIMKTAPSWKNIGAGYQIMVASFADSDGDGFGDIYGITQKLDYLADLGVGALWLTPIQKSDSYHGYDITDYTAVDPKFGSTVSTSGKANGGVVTDATAMADYEELIAEAKKKGIKIVMDLVLNHTSTANRWFIKSGQLDPDYRGYYQWANNVNDPTATIANCWYPYGDHVYSYYAKFGSGMPELNYSYQATRDAVEEMSLFWCEKGVEGFRLDAVKHIYMTDECDVASGDTVITDVNAEGVNYSSDLTKNLNFYKELNYAVKKKYPNVFFVGENFDGNAYQVGPYYEAFDSMFDFYTYFNLTSMAAMGSGTSSVGGYASGWMRGSSKFTGVTGKEYNVSGLKKTWNAPDVYADYSTWRGDDALPGCFTSNHDIARVVNRIAGTGNSTGLQAQGKITSDNFAKYNKYAMLVKLTEIFMPGVTWIYYGDELGMTGNFLMNAETAEDDYADLAYRQPMKWVHGGEVGDGSMTTGYGINGAKSAIYWDEVNASSLVKDATSQAASSTSDYAILAEAIALKNADPKALITGTFTDNNSQNTELIFNRAGGGNTYTIDVDFKNATFTLKKGTATVFSYK
ncbi:MAG: hypothetical protein K6B65_04785 [Bacilli bacterium]|nr:hypothetical protein [Bacilli bacterium]